MSFRTIIFKLRFYVLLMLESSNGWVDACIVDGFQLW